MNINEWIKKYASDNGIELPTDADNPNTLLNLLYLMYLSGTKDVNYIIPEQEATFYNNQGELVAIVESNADIDSFEINDEAYLTIISNGVKNTYKMIFVQAEWGKGFVDVADVHLLGVGVKNGNWVIASLYQYENVTVYMTRYPI